MLVSAEETLGELRCPVSKSRLVRDGNLLVSTDDQDARQRSYPIVDGKPVLINFSQSVVDKEVVTKSVGESQVERTSYSGLNRLVKQLLSPENKATQQNVAHLQELLRARPEPARLLVVGGGSVGQALGPLYDDERIKVYSFDIYASPTVQFVADAHEMPIADGFFDAVIVQAVLEHVLDPDQVVNEIWRVLKPDALVYAETPFMQHVHEGAYDSTRFSDCGHRYLFRRFELIDSGVCGGAGIQLMWSVDYFVRALFRSRTAGKIAKLAIFWVQYLDNLIPRAYAIDAASGVFFFGRKSKNTISPSDIISYYSGANALIAE